MILDRDGVLNLESQHFVKTPSEWIPEPNAETGLKTLITNGWNICVATNQSGIGRGLFSHQDLYHIHERMLKHYIGSGIKFNAIAYCPHLPEDECECRKPKPGLLHELAQRFDIDLRDVPMVGDSLRDLLSAESAGAIPVLVKTGNGMRTINSREIPPNTIICEDMRDVARRFQ